MSHNRSSLSQAALLLLPPWDFETLLTPQAVHPLAVDAPAVATQQRPDAAIAKTGMFPHQFEHPLYQRLVCGAFRRHESLGRTGLLEDGTSPTLRDVEGLTQVLDSTSFARRATPRPGPRVYVVEVCRRSLNCSTH